MSAYWIVSKALESVGIAYNLVADTATAFAPAAANEKEAMVLWVEVGRVERIAEGQLGAGYWRSHNYIQRKAETEYSSDYVLSKLSESRYSVSRSRQRPGCGTFPRQLITPILVAIQLVTL